MRVSILIMAFLPPLRAETSASSARAPVSLHWASSSFLSFSRAMDSSCSQRSSSASLAASTMARAAFSSDSLASLLISSRSLLSWLYSDSSFLLAAAMDWLTLLRSARFSLVSASSCSAPRLCLSAVSRRARLSSRALAMAADFLSAVTLLSAAADLAWDSASTLAWASLTWSWDFLMVFWVSALPAMACSRARPRSAASASSFFFILRASALPLASVSRADCMESRALVWFFLTIANSSSFSAMRRSISVLTWVSSIWHLSTLSSSCSRVASASSRADWSSIFSASSLFLILSISWMERPPSVIWSMMSLISLERVLFSRLTSSSWRTVSSWADLTLNSSEEAFLVSFWLTSRSKDRRSTLPLYSEMVLSNCLAFLSMAALTTWAWSRLVVISLISCWILLLAFSTWASLALRLSMAASASVFLAASFILVIPSSSALATASISYFWRIAAASPSALAFSLRTLSRPAASSSRASLATSPC